LKPVHFTSVAAYICVCVARVRLILTFAAHRALFLPHHMHYTKSLSIHHHRATQLKLVWEKQSRMSIPAP